jgi:uncharacterized protein with HEPN domain
VTRRVDDLLADLAEAADTAAELVGREEALGYRNRATIALRGEAHHRPTGDITTKLPDEVIDATPEIPWRQVKGVGYITAHAYHRIDYEEVWVKLRDDIPRVEKAIKRWRQTQNSA